MDQLDDIAKSTLKAANISEEVLGTLSREDLRDLFPGPENFFRRKAVWHACHACRDDFDEEVGRDSGTSVTESPLPQASMPQASTPVKECPAKCMTPEKTVKLSFPEYVLHTDSELEQVRKQYFELAKKGEEGNFEMSKDLRCRLIRNTMTSMIAILRAKGDGDSDRYPSKPEVTAMAKRIVQYYPMLQDKGSKKTSWITVYAQLYKRLQNVRSPQKASPGGSQPKKRRVGQRSDTDDSTDSTIILDRSSDEGVLQDLGHKEREFHSPDTGSQATTPTRSLSPAVSNKPADVSPPKRDSPAIMAKHYKTLQALYKKKKPNHESVSQLLDLEFPARRAFIDSDAISEENRPGQILEAYPCFKEIGHVMEELRRILDKDNTQYINQVKERWHDFSQNVQFFGMWKKLLKSPMGMEKTEQAVGILRLLPLLFPSGSAPVKKRGDPSEALVHVLEDNEDPGTYLTKRPLSCPVLIVSPCNCLLAVGDVPVTTFPKEQVTEGALHLMAYYYALHLTYPKCIATLLSIIQTEVLHDTIHEKDLTPGYKKSLAEWKDFIGK
ncbi:uncharacterized protein LOC115402283 [Salarias fasciatus]|uniref:uncharacterized protein LOC115402283 n=1 Tax=Salarias fasciatus TaxID=181472 RepID=UPI001176BEF9|nr:uncharacterized protein LOC115402283 [Salarias fasciatus]